MPVVLPSQRTRRPARVFGPRLWACRRSGGREGGREGGRLIMRIKKQTPSHSLSPPSSLPPYLPVAKLELSSEKKEGGGDPPTRS